LQVLKKLTVIAVPDANRVVASSYTVSICSFITLVIAAMGWVHE
jgi:hypothetical protein